MPTLTIVIPGELRGKGRPRFTRSGIAYTDAKTKTAETWIKACAIEQMAGRPCIEGPVTISILVCVPIPRSWSRTKRTNALSNVTRPVGKPDADNMIKLLFDALKYVLFRDDSQVWRVALTKMYSDTPQTSIEATE